MLVYKSSEYTYSFQNFQTIRTFGRDIYNGEITINEANEDQTSLLAEIINFKNKAKPRDKIKKQQKKDILENLYNLFEGREKVLNAFDSKIFPIKTKGTGYLKSKPSSFKKLTPNQMLKRLPIALAQINEEFSKIIYEKNNYEQIKDNIRSAKSINDLNKENDQIL